MRTYDDCRVVPKLSGTSLIQRGGLLCRVLRVPLAVVEGVDLRALGVLPSAIRERPGSMNVREPPRAFIDMVLQVLDTRVNRRVYRILLLTQGGVALLRSLALLPGRPSLLRQ